MLVSTVNYDISGVWKRLLPKNKIRENEEKSGFQGKCNILNNLLYRQKNMIDS